MLSSRLFGIAATVAFLLVAIVSCAPAAIAAQGASIVVRAEPETVLSAVALITPRLMPPSGHTAPIMQSVSFNSVSIVGEDLGYSTSVAISDGVTAAMPAPSGTWGNLLSGMLRAGASVAPDHGRYRVNVNTIVQPNGLTVVTIGSDTEFGSWLVEGLAYALEQHFR